MLRENYRRITLKMRKTKEKILRPVTSKLRRRRLLNPDFTIIASNCIGTRMYQELEMEYSSPFIGMCLYAPCYVKMLNNLDFYLGSKISFAEYSKYEFANLLRSSGNWYPIGLLDNDIELHFLHYRDENEAISNWNRRLQRMKMERLFIVFTDRDMCEETHLTQFNDLPYDKKICFTSKYYPYLQSTVTIKEYQGRPFVDNLYDDFYILERHFDYIDWLNGGMGKK